MTIASTQLTLPRMRDEIRDLLNEFDPADGLASYYALHHDPNRTTLFVHHESDGMVDGFLARCQTGFDLFRQLITLRLRGSNDPLTGLLEEAMAPGRPYLMIIPSTLKKRVGQQVTLSDVVENHVLRLDPSRFQPEMNALVVTRLDADGGPRAEVRRGGQPVAAAGVNWRSPIFAEVYVRVERPARGRGLGRSVVKAVVAELLKMRVTPLYSVSEDNNASYDLAVDVGFVDSGAREVVAQAVRTPAAEA